MLKVVKLPVYVVNFKLNIQQDLASFIKMVPFANINGCPNLSIRWGLPLQQ